MNKCCAIRAAYMALPLQEVSRVLQLGAVDQEIEQPPRSREQSSAKSSRMAVSGRSSPSPPRIWFQPSGSPMTSTRDSAPLKQRNSPEAERQKPVRPSIIHFVHGDILSVHPHGLDRFCRRVVTLYLENFRCTLMIPFNSISTA